jgi:predicted ATP-dependent serine protease
MNQPPTLLQYGNITSEGTTTNVKVIKTGNETFDNFVSRYGGFVVRSSMFLTGTPGSGKTTLSVFIQSVCKDIPTALYSKESSALAIQRQCAEFDVEHGNAFIADNNSCPTFAQFMELIEQKRPKVIILDSLQKVSEDLHESMGEGKAIMHVVNTMLKFVERTDAFVIFIGQMNKNGDFNGPQGILQMADAHMDLNYYPERNERVARWWNGKNRNNGKDGNATLFYTFGKGAFNFYEPDEWEIAKRKLTFLDFMMEATGRYMGSIKKREGYEAVRKELKSKQKVLEGLDISDEEFFLTMAKNINEAVTKAWPATE